jgi:hypothetical protein
MNSPYYNPTPSSAAFMSKVFIMTVHSVFMSATFASLDNLVDTLLVLETRVKDAVSSVDTEVTVVSQISEVGHF